MLKVIEIEPSNSCNIKCEMCHVNFMRNVNMQFIDIETVNKIAKFTNNHIINIGAAFEPTIHPQISKIIKSFSKVKNLISLTTNAVKVTDEFLESIKNNKHIDKIHISFDSADKNIYESIRKGAKFDKVIKNIKNISLAIHSSTSLRMNVVLMKKNIDGIIDIINLCEDLGIEHIGFIVMSVRELDERLLEQSLYNDIKDVKNRLKEAAEYIIKNNKPLSISSALFNNYLELKKEYPNNFYKNICYSNHPKSKVVDNKVNEVQRENIPKKMYVSCSSPWTFVRVDASANVILCYKYTIGNLKKEDLETIISSYKAETIRDYIIQNQNECLKCDFYKFCIKSPEVDFENKENFFSKKILERESKKIESIING